MSLPGAAERGGSGSPPRPAGSGSGFPRSSRLTARKQFQSVYRLGRRVRCRSFTLFALANTLGHCRLGITVTRKIGGAVVRNKIKRRIREVFRSRFAELRPAFDLVVHANRGIDERTTSDLDGEFARGFAQLARRTRR